MKFKKILISLALMFLLLRISAQHATADQWMRLIKAIEYHESKGHENAISRDGKYVGVLQISTVLVNECNKIVGTKKIHI